MGLKKVHILLIEDNKVHVMLIEKAFQQIGTFDYSFSTVENGYRAMQFFNTLRDNPKAQQPDLIFLDLDLPKMNGFDVLYFIKTTPYLKHIPVLILSGSVNYQDMMKSYQNYCSSFLEKPTNPEGFREMVKSIENFWFKVVQLPENHGI
jgi:two-component system, chemotaxis family, response regulator Rcp1